jgi:hypothetical protein
MIFDAFYHWKKHVSSQERGKDHDGVHQINSPYSIGVNASIKSDALEVYRCCSRASHSCYPLPQCYRYRGACSSMQTKLKLNIKELGLRRLSWLCSGIEHGPLNLSISKFKSKYITFVFYKTREDAQGLHHSIKISKAALFKIVFPALLQRPHTSNEAPSDWDWVS